MIFISCCCCCCFCCRWCWWWCTCWNQLIRLSLKGVRAAAALSSLSQQQQTVALSFIAADYPLDLKPFLSHRCRHCPWWNERKWNEAILAAAASEAGRGQAEAIQSVISKLNRALLLPLPLQLWIDRLMRKTPTNHLIHSFGHLCLLYAFLLPSSLPLSLIWFVIALHLINHDLRSNKRSNALSFLFLSLFFSCSIGWTAQLEWTNWCTSAQACSGDRWRLNLA